MIQIIILLYFSYKCNVIIRYLLLGIIFFEKKQPIICSFKNKLYLCIAFERQSYGKCPDGGIGRRVGLKHQWIHFHPGSIPGLGTNRKLSIEQSLLSFFIYSTFPTFFLTNAKRYSSKSLFSLAAQYKYTTFEKSIFLPYGYHRKKKLISLS